MKKIMIALALIGLSYSGADAQTKSSANTPCKCAAISKNARATGVAHVHKHSGGKAVSGDTYQVCREKGGHYECCTHHKSVVTKVAAK